MIAEWAIENRALPVGHGERFLSTSRLGILAGPTILRVRFGSITKPDELRALVRRQLGYLLPKETLERKGKRGPDEAILRAVWGQWAVICELMRQPLVVDRGYVDAAAFKQSIERAYHGAELETSSFVRTLGLEIWLRHLGGASHHSDSESLRRVVGIP